MHGGIGFTWNTTRASTTAGARARRRVRPRRRLSPAGRRHRHHHRRAQARPRLDPETEKLRDEIRAEVAALKEIPADQRTDAIVEGGWVMPYLPKPWGRSATPVEQIITAQEFSAGRVRRPMLGIASFLSRPLSRSAMKTRSNASCRRHCAVK